MGSKKFLGQIFFFNGFSIELIEIQCWMFHMNLFQHLFNSGEKYTFIDNQQPKQIDFREPLEIRICLYKLVVL